MAWDGDDRDYQLAMRQDKLIRTLILLEASLPLPLPLPLAFHGRSYFTEVSRTQAQATLLALPICLPPFDFPVCLSHPISCMVRQISQIFTLLLAVFIPSHLPAYQSDRFMRRTPYYWHEVESTVQQASSAILHHFHQAFFTPDCIELSPSWKFGK